MHLREKKKLGAETKYLEQYWEQDMEQNSEHDMERENSVMGINFPTHFHFSLF